MFEGAGTMVEVGGMTTGGGEYGDGGGGGGRCEWREIDRQLRRIARRRGELDVEELRWLARAERAELHRQLGMASMLEYVERVLGYGPKAGKDRLRVARKLEELPRMAEALDSGGLPFSAVRELSRCVTPATESEWLDAVRGKCLREIEDMSSGRRPGDRPGDPVDPHLRTRPISVDLTPPTYALFLDARRRLEEELGHALTDDEMIFVMCSAVLDPAPRGAAASAATVAEVVDDVGAPSEAVTVPPATPRVAPYQIALTICEYCERAWHDATGRSVEVPPSTVEMARCDAQHIGHIDCEEPSRAYQEIPPAVARFVLRRDRGRCQVPGCRSCRWIHIHHIIPREQGGANDPWNLICLCSAHHQALHRKQIAISGRAPDTLVFDLQRFGGPPPETHDSASSTSTVVEDVSSLAQQALVRAGFMARDVRAAIARARPHVGPGNFEALVRRALRELSASGALA